MTERLFVDLFLDAHSKAPAQIILDLDVTDDPQHGQQQGRYFHGYYDCYCYPPLFVFCGRHLLAAKLRRALVRISVRRIKIAMASACPWQDEFALAQARLAYAAASHQTDTAQTT